MIKIKCNSCNSQYDVSDDKIGKKAKCNCGNILDITEVVEKKNTILKKISGIFLILVSITFPITIFLVENTVHTSEKINLFIIFIITCWLSYHHIVSKNGLNNILFNIFIILASLLELFIHIASMIDPWSILGIVIIIPVIVLIFIIIFIDFCITKFKK